ncbi:MAG: universal stress protein [Bacteroidales bacterium]|nr:universal stress protein [Bacteroidales bacterium]
MNSAKNKILVPVDFSEHSIAGLEQSFIFARLANAEIVLLHVIADSGALWGMFSGSEKDEMEKKLDEKLKSYAEVISKKEDIKVSTIIEKGKLIDTIIKVSEKIEAKMIVVGTTGSKNIMQKIIGSNALRLIRETTCPLVTVKDGAKRENCNNIVLPLDLTKETNQKVSTAIGIAEFFHSKIWAVSVATTKDEYIIRRLKTQLSKVKKFIQDSNVECDTMLVKSSNRKESMAEALMEFSHKVNADLMLIMTQQEAEIVEYFIGSLAKEIIHKADLPVMSVVPKRKLKSN